VYVDDRARRVGIIVDYKYGYHKVSIEKNAQLAFYACAMQKEFTDQGKELDRVKAVIYQPRGGEDNPYKECVFTNAQLKTWTKKFLKAGEQIFIKQKPKFKVGTWCKFCRAQAICKAYSSNVIQESELALVDTTAVLPVPEQLDDQTLRNIILNADKLEDFLSAAKKYGKQRYLKGHPIQGTKCVISSQGRRTWQKDDEAIGSRLIELGVKEPYKFK